MIDHAEKGLTQPRIIPFREKGKAPMHFTARDLLLIEACCKHDRALSSNLLTDGLDRSAPQDHRPSSVKGDDGVIDLSRLANKT
jgi:hypothetical protein